MAQFTKRIIFFPVASVAKATTTYGTAIDVSDLDDLVAAVHTVHTGATAATLLVSFQVLLTGSKWGAMPTCAQPNLFSFPSYAGTGMHTAIRMKGAFGQKIRMKAVTGANCHVMFGVYAVGSFGN